MWIIKLYYFFLMVNELFYHSSSLFNNYFYLLSKWLFIFLKLLFSFQELTFSIISLTYGKRKGQNSQRATPMTELSPDFPLTKMPKQNQCLWIFFLTPVSHMNRTVYLTLTFWLSPQIQLDLFKWKFDLSLFCSMKKKEKSPLFSSHTGKERKKERSYKI